MKTGLQINFFDIFLLLLILYFAAKGLRRGLFQELIGFVGIMIALALALMALEPASPALSNFTGLAAGESAAIVFFFAFTAVLFLLKYAEKWINRHAHLKLADAINKAAGAALGLLKGSMVASLLVLFFSLVPMSSAIQQQVQNSTLQEGVSGIAPAVYDSVRKFIPGHKRFVAYLENLAGLYHPAGLDQNLLRLLIDLGSTRVDEWTKEVTK